MTLRQALANPRSAIYSAKFSLPLLLALYAVVVWQFHIGYHSLVDFDFLIRGAVGWLNHFPYLGTTHWELRHPFVLTLAASLGLFGPSQFSLLLPSVLAGAATLCLFYLIVAKLANPRSGLLAGILLATTPIFCAASTMLFPDIFDAFFSIAAILAYVHYQHGNGTRRFWFLPLTGLLLGLAFVVRETAIVASIALFTYYMLCVRRDVVPHFAIVGVFILLAAFDPIYGYVKTGDPFYRFTVDIRQYFPYPYWHSQSSIIAPEFNNAEVEIAGAYSPLPEQHYLSGTEKRSVGPISIHPSVDLYVLFFINHEYGGIFFALLAALVAAAFARPELGNSRTAIIVFLCFIVVAPIVLNYILNVRPHPRYYLVMTVAVIGITSVFLERLMYGRVGVFPAVIVVGALFGNLLGLDVRTPRPVGEILLAENPWKLEDAIHVHPVTLKAARLYLDLSEHDVSVSDAAPAAGDYYLHVSDSAFAVSERSQFQPGQNWREVWRLPPDERLIGQILRMAGVLDRLPSGLHRKFLTPDSEVVLYRLPDDAKQ